MFSFLCFFWCFLGVFWGYTLVECDVIHLYAKKFQYHSLTFWTRIYANCSQLIERTLFDVPVQMNNYLCFLFPLEQTFFIISGEMVNERPTRPNVLSNAKRSQTVERLTGTLLSPQLNPDHRLNKIEPSRT